VLYAEIYFISLFLSSTIIYAQLQTISDNFEGKESFLGWQEVIEGIFILQIHPIDCIVIFLKFSKYINTKGI